MATVRKIQAAAADPAAHAILAALPFPVIVVGESDSIAFVNASAEQFFDQSAGHLVGRPLDRIVAKDSPLRWLIAQVRADGATVSEHDLDLVLPRGGGRSLSIVAAPLDESRTEIVLTLHGQSAARSLERQLSHRGAARSLTAMAQMLVHEVKNPLAGIRGAAQLLERVVEGADQALARLICEESDRICALVDRIGVFSDDMMPERGPVNIHEVLERVQKSAAAGFARHVRFTTDYDPSLPPVLGDRDQLVQVFLNLVKNAAEASPRQDDAIHFATGFRRGVRLAVQGGEGRIQLPLMVSITDEGSGIPADIAQHLFDPFVTTKTNGTGLGLAVVAKIVNDHGGLVEFDTGQNGTVFRVFLPLYEGPETDDGKGS